MSTDDAPITLVKKGEQKVASLETGTLMCHKILAMMSPQTRHMENIHPLTPMMVLASTWLILHTPMPPTLLETSALRRRTCGTSPIRIHCLQKPLVKRSGRSRTCLVRRSSLIDFYMPHRSQALPYHPLVLRRTNIRTRRF